MPSLTVRLPTQVFAVTLATGMSKHAFAKTQGQHFADIAA